MFAAVASDGSGATDLAGMLADRGMRPVLILDEPWREDLQRWTTEADAVVISSSARMEKGVSAYEQTGRSVRLLRTLVPQMLQLKYCSTFDLEFNGAIGSAIEAAMDEMDEQFTIALPAFPVHDGNVNREHAGSMAAAHLQTQTKRRVGLVSSFDIRQGSERIRGCLAHLRADGVEIAIVDDPSERDVQSICEAVSELRLVTGGSALAMHLPTSWIPSKPVHPKRRSGGRGLLVVAGSYSPVTRQQNAWLAAHHAVVITLDAMNLAAGSMPDSVFTPICEELASGGVCLLQTSINVDAVHEFFRSQNKTEAEAGENIARSLAAFVRDVMSLITPAGLIVAGGETAGALSRALGFGALAVGPSIEASIPVCVTLSGSALPVVLKPGNSGSESFYAQAIKAIHSLEFER